MKKLFKQLHLWLSIPFGIVITILCGTGAIMVFEKELQQMSNPSRYYANEVKGEPMPLSQLLPTVKKQLPDTMNISSVTIPWQANYNYTMGIEGGQRVTAMVDPFSGEVREIVDGNSQSTFFPTVRKLHRWLLVDTERGEFSWGKFLTGISTLAFVFITITGIIIWMPKNIHSLKNRLSVKLKKGGFRFWYDTHMAGGIYTAVFLLVFSITGLTWSFNWYRTGFYKLFGVEMAQGGGGPQEGQSNTNRGERGAEGENRGDRENNRRGDVPRESRPEEKPSAMGGEHGEHLPNDTLRRERPLDSATGRPSPEIQGKGQHWSGHGDRREARGSRANYAVWDSVLLRLKGKYAEFGSITIQQGSASVAFNRTGNTRAADKYSFNPRSGEITESTPYDNTNRAAIVRGWVYRLHVGSWGGMLTRVLSFIACIVGTTLPITGYYMYYRRWKKKRQKA